MPFLVQLFSILPGVFRKISFNLQCVSNTCCGLVKHRPLEMLPNSVSQCLLILTAQERDYLGSEAMYWACISNCMDAQVALGGRHSHLTHL